MENENPTPMSPVVEPGLAPEIPHVVSSDVASDTKPAVEHVEAPMATPVADAPHPGAAAMAEHKPSHKTLYILLAVFVVMSGALATVSFLKPELITSTYAWVTGKTMHAASPDSKVLVNGEWVESANPDAELGNVKMPSAPAVEEGKADESAEMPAVTEEVVFPEVPVVEPTMEPGAETVPAEATEPQTPGAFDLGSAQDEPTPVAPEAVEPSPETPAQ